MLNQMLKANSQCGHGVNLSQQLCSNYKVQTTSHGYEQDGSMQSLHKQNDRKNSP